MLNSLIMVNFLSIRINRTIKIITTIVIIMNILLHPIVSVNPAIFPEIKFEKKKLVNYELLERELYSYI